MASWRPWRLVLALGPGQSDSGKWRWHRTQRALGARYNYLPGISILLSSSLRAAGLEVKDWQNLILVNQLGQRFYDETKGDYPNGNLYNEFNPYRTGDYRNNASIDYNPTHYNFFNAAVAMNAASGPSTTRQVHMGHLRCRGGGRSNGRSPRRMWIRTAIASVPTRWQNSPPPLKTPIRPHRWMVPPCKPGSATIPLSTPVLIGISASLCPSKKSDAPFYAAWATPLVHDTRAGLRINARCQVMDMQGQVIPGLYCAGIGRWLQPAWVGRCTAQGYIAGKYAAAE